MDDELITQLVAAVQDLNPQPRERQWTSLSFCVLDAVYSIGAHYDHHVVPVVKRVAADFEVNNPSVPMSAPESADPVPLAKFLGRYHSTEALLNVTLNRQNTSTHCGIRKAEAVLRYTKILCEHEARTLDDARTLLADDARLDAVQTALQRVPGEGSSGVRRGYLWMLVGDQESVKPDRMVLRWLAGHGAAVNVEQARGLLREIAERLSTQNVQPVTPWAVDHAIWRAARSTL